MVQILLKTIMSIRELIKGERLSKRISLEISAQSETLGDCVKILIFAS